jgi:hypothetical protein
MTQAMTVEPQSEIDLKEFLIDLTDLCRRYGVGLGGSPEPYFMEPEDHWYSFGLDQDGRLILD